MRRKRGREGRKERGKQTNKVLKSCRACMVEPLFKRRKMKVK